MMLTKENQGSVSKKREKILREAKTRKIYLIS